MFELTGFAADIFPVAGGLFIFWRLCRRLLRTRLATTRAPRDPGAANG